jgi:CO/xanthine dehydrogenase Mo-binding subunit
MIGYDKNQLEMDEGIGLGIVLHGGCQLGAIAAKVAVNRITGQVKVKHVCCAFDIGTVINLPMATVGIRGGVAWGIGHTLSEEVKLNGHGPETVRLSQYHYARFSHMPTINIAFRNCHTPGSRPRGCGEIPVIPTMGAIANAIYNAIGIRFYSLPITPEKVKKALGNF